MEELVQMLIKNNKTISVMESCTGGMLANEITNINDASKVFSYGVVTYSNEAKIKMGVSEKIINNYSVYSSEVARDMALSVANFSDSNYGIGVTGKLKKMDINNLYGMDDIVYFCIYDRDNSMFYSESLYVKCDNRVDNKREVVNNIVEKMLEIIK